MLLNGNAPIPTSSCLVAQTGGGVQGLGRGRDDVRKLADRAEYRLTVRRDSDRSAGDRAVWRSMASSGSEYTRMPPFTDFDFEFDDTVCMRTTYEGKARWNDRHGAPAKVLQGGIAQRKRAGWAERLTVSTTSRHHRSLRAMASNWGSVVCHLPMGIGQS